MNETQLKEIRNIWIDFLNLPFDIKTYTDKIQHPIFSSYRVLVGTKFDGLKHYNLTNPVEHNRCLAYYIKESQNWDVQDYFISVQPEFRLNFLDKTKDLLCDKDLCDALIFAYTSTSFPNSNPHISKNRIVNLFSYARNAISTYRDDTYYLLQPELTIYRGVDDYNNNRLYATDWCINVIDAINYAQVRGHNGAVYKATIPTSAIFTIIDGEAIIDYTKIIWPVEFIGNVRDLIKEGYIVH